MIRVSEREWVKTTTRYIANKTTKLTPLEIILAISFQEIILLIIM